MDRSAELRSLTADEIDCVAGGAFSEVITKTFAIHAGPVSTSVGVVVAIGIGKGSSSSVWVSGIAVG